MRILFLETNLSPYHGGVARVTWQLSKFFCQKGIECYFAYSFRDWDVISTEHKLSFDKSWNSQQLMSHLGQYIIDHHIDVVINQGYSYKAFVSFFKRIRKELHCYVISCFHMDPTAVLLDSGDWRFKIKNIIARMVGKGDLRLASWHNLYQVSDVIVVLSSSFLNDFRNMFGVSDCKRLRAISNPLSFDQSECLSQEERIKQVLLISRMDNLHKNLKGALRIWKEIERRGHDDWQLVVGGYGPDEEMILNYANQLGLKRMIWKGLIDNPEPYYRVSPIFMMTSNDEGFGMTLTEALQKGCIPLAFDSFSTVHDIIQNGYNGFLIPRDDEELYAEKLEKLMNSTDLRATLSKQCTESAGKFSLYTIGTQWMTLLSELENEE